MENQNKSSSNSAKGKQKSWQKKTTSFNAHSTEETKWDGDGEGTRNDHKGGKSHRGGRKVQNAIATLKALTDEAAKIQAVEDVKQSSQTQIETLEKEADKLHAECDALEEKLEDFQKELAADILFKMSRTKFEFTTDSWCNNQTTHKYKVVSLCDWKHDDLRADTISQGELKHQAAYAEVKYTRREDKPIWVSLITFICGLLLLLPTRFVWEATNTEITLLFMAAGLGLVGAGAWIYWRNRNPLEQELVVSLELFTQLTTHSNVSFDRDPNVTWERLNREAGRTHSVSLDRYLTLEGTSVVGNTVMLAYAFYMQLREEMEIHPFPRCP
jgi:cell division protein FtsB